MNTQTIYKVLNIPVPETTDHERTVIAALASSPDMFGDVSAIINADMFNNTFCREVWEFMGDAYNKGNDFEVTTLMQRFPNFMQEFGERIIEVGGSISTQEFALNLRNAAAQRRAYIAAGDFLATASDRLTTEQDIIEGAERLARAIEGPTPLQGSRHISEIIAEVKEANAKIAKARQEGRTIRVTTGFAYMDEVFYGGFKSGQLVIIAARPSVGKTALMLQMAEGAAEAGNPVQIFSLEMRAEELAERLLYSTGEMSPGQLSYGRISADAFGRAEVKLNKLPLYVNDFSRSLDDITTRLTQSVKKGRCSVAFIDYLGLINDALNFGNAKLYQVIARVTGTLKALAKRLEIPIVLLCQLNREAAREGRAPELFDLRDSGSIEQDADIVMMLESKMATNGTLVVWLRKNRSGQKERGFVLKPNDTYSAFDEIECLDENKAPVHERKLTLPERVTTLPDDEDEKDNLPF